MYEYLNHINNLLKNYRPGDKILNHFVAVNGELVKHFQQHGFGNKEENTKFLSRLKNVKVGGAKVDEEMVKNIDYLAELVAGLYDDSGKGSSETCYTYSLNNGKGGYDSISSLHDGMKLLQTDYTAIDTNINDLCSKVTKQNGRYACEEGYMKELKDTRRDLSKRIYNFINLVKFLKFAHLYIDYDYYKNFIADPNNKSYDPHWMTDSVKTDLRYNNPDPKPVDKVKYKVYAEIIGLLASAPYGAFYDVYQTDGIQLVVNNATSIIDIQNMESSIIYDKIFLQRALNDFLDKYIDKFKSYFYVDPVLIKASNVENAIVATKNNFDKIKDVPQRLTSIIDHTKKIKIGSQESQKVIELLLGYINTLHSMVTDDTLGNLKAQLETMQHLFDTQLSITSTAPAPAPTPAPTPAPAPAPTPAPTPAPAPAPTPTPALAPTPTPGPTPDPTP